MDNLIDQNFFNVTLKCLSVPTLRIVSTLLNPIKYIPTKENLPRDWRGLADLTGCNSEDMSLLNCSSDPSYSVLKKWSEQEGSTVKNFLLYLAKLDRYDVYDDIISLVIADINNLKTKVRHNVDTSLFITLKDRELEQQGLPPKQYDASILYSDEDRKFAAEIVNKLEQEHKLEIFMKERDLIGGTIEHDATMKIIANRSNRLIIVLSPEFLESSENKYFISFAQSIGIEQRQRKIIPCVYKDCEIPFELRPLHKLYYTRQNALCNFYDKLYASVIPARQFTPRSTEININSSSSTNTNNLTVPQLTKSAKEHSSLPELSDQTGAQINDTNTSVQERHNSDTISLSSLRIEDSKSKNRFSRIKKIFKKKQSVSAS